MITDLSLFIGGTEWVIILFLVMILLLGSNRLPQFSKALGKVIGEYQRARSTIEEEITKTSKMVNTPVTNIDTLNKLMTTPKAKIDETTDAKEKENAPTPVVTEREKFEAIARALEIEPAGKSTEELKQLISRKINK